MEAEIETTVERYKKDTINMAQDKITINHDFPQVSKKLIRLPVIKPLCRDIAIINISIVFPFFSL